MRWIKKYSEAKNLTVEQKEEAVRLEKQCRRDGHVWEVQPYTSDEKVVKYCCHCGSIKIGGT